MAGIRDGRLGPSLSQSLRTSNLSRQYGSDQKTASPSDQKKKKFEDMRSFKIRQFNLADLEQDALAARKSNLLREAQRHSIREALISKKDFYSQRKLMQQVNERDRSQCVKCVCLPRFAQDVLDSFIDLEICSSASKSHHVKQTEGRFSGDIRTQLGNLLINSAIKSNSNMSSNYKGDVDMAGIASSDFKDGQSFSKRSSDQNKFAANVRTASVIPMPKTTLACKPPLAPAVHRPTTGTQWSHANDGLRCSSNAKMYMSSNLKVTPDQRMKQTRVDSDESHGNVK